MLSALASPLTSSLTSPVAPVAALGPELAPALSTFTLSGNWTYAAGVLTKTTGGTMAVPYSPVLALEAGAFYQIAFDHTVSLLSYIRFDTNANRTGTDEPYNGTGRQTLILAASDPLSTKRFRIATSSVNMAGTISNLSIRKVL